MKSTTVRFSDDVYQDLEAASRLTGLPINSIVTVACLEWLRGNVTAAEAVYPTQNLARWRAQRLRRAERLAARLGRLPPPPPGGPYPLCRLSPPAQDPPRP